MSIPLRRATANRKSLFSPTPTSSESYRPQDVDIAPKQELPVHKTKKHLEKHGRDHASRQTLQTVIIGLVMLNVFLSIYINLHSINSRIAAINLDHTTNTHPYSSVVSIQKPNVLVKTSDTIQVSPVIAYGNSLDSKQDVDPLVERAAEKSSNTWRPSSPWEKPPKGYYKKGATGSFENCTNVDPHSSNQQEQPPNSMGIDNDIAGSIAGSIIVSCRSIKYRAPATRIQTAGPIIYGILSAAGGSGPQRRNAIRSTWAATQTNTNTQTNTQSTTSSHFFVVAGPWNEIQEEYRIHQDLIWIDRPESYDGADSVLTYKTLSFLTIAQLYGSVEDSNNGWKYAVKVDDDCYVNTHRFQTHLHQFQHPTPLDYVGQLFEWSVTPKRDKHSKWSVNYFMYPEPNYPRYVVGGGGLVLSRFFVEKAVRGGHVGKLRGMAFEDVAVGMLAERSGVIATHMDGFENFRSRGKGDVSKEVKCVNKGKPLSHCFHGNQKWLELDLGETFIQHRVDLEDMVNLHTNLGLTVQPVKKASGLVDE